MLYKVSSHGFVQKTKGTTKQEHTLYARIQTSSWLKIQNLVQKGAQVPKITWIQLDRIKIEI